MRSFLKCSAILLLSVSLFAQSAEKNAGAEGRQRKSHAP